WHAGSDRRRRSCREGTWPRRSGRCRGRAGRPRRRPPTRRDRPRRRGRRWRSAGAWCHCPIEDGRAGRRRHRAKMFPMSTSSPRRPTVRFASRGSSHFDVLLAAFCVVLVVSNVVATKPLEVGSGSVMLGPVPLWPLVLDGGVVLSPLAYVLGDVISEVYGLRAARRAIWTGFGAALLAVATFFVVQALPPAGWYENQAA